MHFTYREPDRKMLRQGDLLRKTPELIAVIQSVHPHYATESYMYFQVLTQTCDLVRRDNLTCKSRYLSLAAVRSLDFVLDRFIQENSRSVTIGEQKFYHESAKGRVIEFLRKLFNNNDTNHFFLNEDSKLGLNSHCCTHLQLSIALRAYEHYDTCLDAKFLELAEPFDAKLGWLVGNLYSRVGTKDYSDTLFNNDSEFGKHVDQTLKQYMSFLSKDQFEFAAKNSNDIDSVEYLLDRVKTNAESQRKERIDTIVKSISKNLKSMDSDSIKNFVSNNPGLFKI
jgi:hypothetical protein